MPPPKGIVPNKIWPDYGPFPTVVGNTMGVEFSSVYPGTFKPIEPGTPFTALNHSVQDVSDFTGMVFLRQTIGENNEFQKQVWATPPILQDLYNYEISFSDDAATYPIFKRRYLVLRDGYTRTAEGAVFTGIYSVSVTAGGAGYPNGGTVTFTGGGGTGASAIVIVDSSGAIVKITLKNEGSGYTSAPTVVLPAIGSGGSASAKVHPAGCLLVDENVIRTPDKDWDSLYFLVERTYETLPGPERVSWVQNPQTQVASSVTEQRTTTASVAKPTPSLGQNVQIKHLNAEVAEITTKQVDNTDLANFYMTFPGEGNWELPPVLMGVQINWDVAVATGTYQEQGTGEAVGASASLSLNASGSAQGSASALGDLVIIWAPRPAVSLPWLDIFSFIPSPVSLSQMLTDASVKYSEFIGSSTTVNAWPLFNTQPHTIWMSGQKASVSADSTTKCAVSLNAEDTSFAQANGNGTKADLGSNVKSVTIPDSIHGAITFTGSTFVFVEAAAFSSAVLIPGQNWPGGSSMSQSFQFAVAQVTPSVLAPTPVSAYPTTGIYLKSPQASPGDDGYTTCRSRLCNFAILSNGVTLGQPQITVADFNGLSGSHFKTGKAQITTVDFTSASGSTLATGLAQVTQLAFAGFGGSHFVTGSDALYWLLYDFAGDVIAVWYNTGTETQPTVAGATTYLEVTISPTGTANNVASQTQAAINGTYYPATFHAAIPIITTPTITVSTIYFAPTTNSIDGNTGVPITTIQVGVIQNAGKSLLLPSASSGTFGVWFSTGPETQPDLSIYGVGTYVKVTVTPTSNAAAVTAAFASAMTPYSTIWTTGTSGDVVTLTSVSMAVQAAASNVNSGAVITVTQTAGNVGLYFNIYGYQGMSPTPIWFNTGTEIAPTVAGSRLQVVIATGNTAAQIAAAVVAQIPALIGPTWSMAQINGGGTNTAAQFTASANRTTMNAVDVTSGAAITTPQSGQPANV